MKKLSLITICFFIIDIIIFNISNIDYSYNTINYIPSLSYIILLINIDNVKLNDKIILLLILGLFQDILAFNFTLINMIMNILIYYLYKYWSNNISGTTLEYTILLVTIIFCKELLIFIFYDFINITNLTITTYILNSGLITLIFNILIIPIIIIFSKNYLYK